MEFVSIIIDILSLVLSPIENLIFNFLWNTEKNLVSSSCPEVFLTTCDKKENANEILKQSEYYFFEKIDSEDCEEYIIKNNIKQSPFVRIQKINGEVEFDTNNYYITISGKNGKTAKITNFVFRDCYDVHIKRFTHSFIGGQDKITLICRRKDRPYAIIMKYDENYTLTYVIRNSNIEDIIKPQIKKTKKFYRKKSKR